MLVRFSLLLPVAGPVSWRLPASGMVAVSLARLSIFAGVVLIGLLIWTFLRKPNEGLSYRYGWVITNQRADIVAVQDWLVYVQRLLWELAHPSA